MEEQNKQSLMNKNLLQRIITAAILAPLLLWVLISQNEYVGYLFAVMCFGLLIEWILLLFKARVPNRKRIVYLFLGTLYIVGGIFGYYQYYLESATLGVLLLLTIWATDIGAYFAGRLIGGPKLAVAISPNKTWSGAIGGLTAATIIATFASFVLKFDFDLEFIGFFIFCSILGQIGDLIESATKRSLDVKDASQVLPGHGGLLDRLDSLLFIGLFLLMLLSIIDYQIPSL